MFDKTAVYDRCTSIELATLVETNHRDLMVLENRVLLLAAAWADAHDPDSTSDDYAPLIHRSRIVGGDGTPAVSEYAATEFGALQGVGYVAAWSMIADALDLRHRFPRIWVQVNAGQVKAWQARRVAEATRELSYEQARDIDDALAGYLGMLPWPRTQKLLTAAILAVDPDQARERRELAKAERTVYATKSAYGLKLIIARAADGEVNVFMATINRLADILKLDGDDSTVEVRRSKAIGILGQPGRALQLLLDHRTDPTDQPEPAADHDPGECEPDEQKPTPQGDSGQIGRPFDPSTSSGQALLKEREGGLDLTPPGRYDPVAARPKVVLHYHLSDAIFSTGDPGAGLVRPDNGDDLLTVNQLIDYLADTGCPVKIVPVVNPDQIPPVDGYEIPNRIRDAVRYRNFVDVFPYGTCTSASMDLDHTLAYQHDGGPPGQTNTSNLGPLARSNHRSKTHGRWRTRQPVPGTYLWRSPTGWIYLVTNHGTLNLGNNPYAHALWHTTLAYGEIESQPLAA